MNYYHYKNLGVYERMKGKASKSAMAPAGTASDSPDLETWGENYSGWK